MHAAWLLACPQEVVRPNSSILRPPHSPPSAQTVAAMDVLVPKVGEIIGGSQREDDLATLRARMSEMHVPEDPLKWYLDLRKYGTVPHAGFGLGFERLIMYGTWGSISCAGNHAGRRGCSPHGFHAPPSLPPSSVTGLENIRDVIPFPRWPGNASG